MTDGSDKPSPQSGAQTGSQIIVRKLATILSADVAEFSRLMNEDEEQTLRIFRGHKKIFESLVVTHHGRVFNTAGDAILAEFASAVEAVRCATDVQSALRTRNDQLPPSRQVRFRIGINLGDVMIQGQDLLGDGVNVAARLQTAAEPGGICISGSVHDQIRNKLSLSFQALGERNYKNIPQPVRTFSIVEAEGGGALPGPKPPISWRGPGVWIAAGLLLLVGGSYAAYVVHERGKPKNPPAIAAKVQPEPAPSQATLPEPVKPTTNQAAAPQAQPKLNTTPPVKQKAELIAPSAKAALPGGNTKLMTKSGEAPHPSVPDEPVEPSALPGAAELGARPHPYDGSYSGQICYGKTPTLPAHCYQAKGSVRGTKLTGRWSMPNESSLTTHLEGEVAPSGEVSILIYTDRADGSRFATINLTGKIHSGLLDASGKFLKGRSASLSWHVDSDAPR